MSILKRNQIPRRGSQGTLWNSGDLKPRSTGAVSAANPLKVGDIVDTTLGSRAMVVAVTGSQATLMMEHGTGDGYTVKVNASGSGAV